MRTDRPGRWLLRVPGRCPARARRPHPRRDGVRHLRHRHDDLRPRPHLGDPGLRHPVGRILDQRVDGSGHGRLPGRLAADRRHQRHRAAGVQRRRRRHPRVLVHEHVPGARQLHRSRAVRRPQRRPVRRGQPELHDRRPAQRPRCESAHHRVLQHRPGRAHRHVQRARGLLVRAGGRHSALRTGRSGDRILLVRHHPALGRCARARHRSVRPVRHAVDRRATQRDDPPEPGPEAARHEGVRLLVPGHEPGRQSDRPGRARHRAT